MESNSILHGNYLVSDVLRLYITPSGLELPRSVVYSVDTERGSSDEVRIPFGSSACLETQSLPTTLTPHKRHKFTDYIYTAANMGMSVILDMPVSTYLILKKWPRVYNGAQRIALQLIDTNRILLAQSLEWKTHNLTSHGCDTYRLLQQLTLCYSSDEFHSSCLAHRSLLGTSVHHWILILASNYDQSQHWFTDPKVQ